MHGKTEILHLHQEFIQTIQLGDLESCICLPQITNYFFTFNHPNYAKWLVQYYDNIIFLFFMIKAALALKEPKRIFQDFQLIYHWSRQLMH